MRENRDEAQALEVELCVSNLVPTFTLIATMVSYYVFYTF